MIIKNIISTQVTLGGIKSVTPFQLDKKNKSQDILKNAVKRMLPGGPLAKKQLSKLKMYYGLKHPHESTKSKRN